MRTEQGDAFVKLVLHGDPGQADWTFQQALGWWRQRHGSGRKAAAAAGVPESTFRGWWPRPGKKTSTPAPARLAAFLAAVRLDRTRISTLGDPGTLVPMTTQERKRQVRSRDVSGRQLKLRAGTTAAAQQVWAETGDSGAALRRFVQGIGEPWYRAQLARGAGEDDLVDDDIVLDDDYGATIG